MLRLALSPPPTDATFPSKECWEKGPFLDFEKMVYQLNYKPKRPEVAKFCYFSIITNEVTLKGFNSSKILWLEQHKNSWTYSHTIEPIWYFILPVDIFLYFEKDQFRYQKIFFLPKGLFSSFKKVQLTLVMVSGVILQFSLSVFASRCLKTWCVQIFSIQSIYM